MHACYLSVLSVNTRQETAHTHGQNAPDRLWKWPMGMTGRSHGARAAFWLMALLALMIRLGGSTPLSGASSDDPLDVLTALSVLCEPPSNSLPDDRHHRPALSDGAMLLAVASDMHDPCVIPSLFGRGRATFVTRAHFWCFPPVRGPPAPARNSHSPRGPPLIA